MRALLLLGILAGCGPADVDDSVPVDPESVPILDDAAYRFCHQAGADATLAREFCPLLEDLPPEACPGLRATCEEGAAEQSLDAAGCLGMPRLGERPGAMPAAEPEPPRAPLTWEAWSCDLPDDLGGWASAVLRWAVALGIALLVLVLIRVLVLAMGWRRRSAPGPLRPSSSPPPAEEVPDLPSDDLLGAASEALSSGRYADAVILARGAALRGLAEQGRIRLHRARTDREYLRAVRRDAEVHAPLHEILSAVEGQRWGGAQVGDGLAQRVIAAAKRVIRVGGGVLLMLLLVGAGDEWRFGPQGDAALFEVLSRAGFEVSWRLRGLSRLDDEVDVLVLDLSGITPREEDWTAIREWVSGGRLLVVAGEAQEGLPELGAPAALSEALETRLEPVIEGWFPAPRWPDGPRAAWVAGETIAWVVVGETSSERNTRRQRGDDVGSDGPVVVVGALPLGEGGVVAVADPRLLWNGALIHPANAELVAALPILGDALGLWALPTQRVQLATTAAGGSDSPVGSLANARLLPFVLQLFALVGLVALWRGWPFAPLRDPPREGRLRFVDHVRALASRYARLGASRRALGAYASLWLGRLGPDGLREAARRSGMGADEASALIEAATAAADDTDGPSSPQDFTVMEALWRITKRS